MIKLTDDWQPFWGGHIVDEEKTDATRVIHSPERGDSHFVFDAEWENQGVSYAHAVKCADGVFRLYYIGYPRSANFLWSCVCCIESTDGLNWTRPEYGIFEFNGSKKNNIVWTDQRKGAGIVDNFWVFYDENPNCPAEEKYKALGLEPCVDEKWDECDDLWCYVSPDGIHWKFGWVAMKKPEPVYWYFDSDNHAVWDGEKYVLYFRGRHILAEKLKGVDVSSDEFKRLWNGVYNYRDIRYAYSYDFKHWEIKGQIEYLDKEDFQLYASHIFRYPRNKNIFVGFPVRNVERISLKGSFEHLGGAEGAKTRMAIAESELRAGTVITDSLFMSSCDGLHWDRDLEAFYKTGEETADNWRYGDGYIVPYLWETEGRFSRIDREFSFYYTDYHYTNRPQELVMYRLRLDGFRSLKGGYYGSKITMKPFVFEGDTLYLNFSTAAPGNVYITITDEEGNKTESCEIFGDTTERPVDFDKPLSAFAGKKVVMELKLKEAEVYSFRFGKKKD